MGDMDDVVNEFLVESYENLDRLDTDLLALESNPQAREMLASIFRTIHTIKGTCGFLGFSRLESLTHVGENLLSLLRDGKLTVGPEITTALLALVDAVRQMLSNIEKQGAEGAEEFAELKSKLTALQGGAGAAKPAAPRPATTTSATTATATAAPTKTPAAPPAAPASVAPPAPEPPAQPNPAAALPAKKNKPIGQVLIDAGAIQPDDLQRAVAKQNAGDRRKLGEILIEQGSIQPHVLDALLAGQKTSIADNSIRVDVTQLDRLMNLVGELVLARNQVLQFTSGSADNAFVATTQRLNLITTELQESVMKTRMQPISTVWSKLPRIVRDLASSLGKKIRVEMDGKETELDKTILEAIKDPLTHIVRNSCDHGLETPEVRKERGKPEEGVLLLRAFHEGGQVQIEIRDDGAGIDLERVKKKAVTNGLISQEQASRMGEREACNLIFAAGLSTAQKVTNVSGRGVGMDVVRSNIEKIGGQVDLSNRFLEGLTIRIKIPLTLAIIPALVVVTGGERFAIPQVSLLELVRLEGDAAKQSIEMIEGAPVYRLRGQLLPIVFLDRVLGMRAKSGEDEAVNIVVLQADERQFGLVVNRICDTEEIVVKPLGKLLKGLTVFAGATIMGDGRVALILDVMGIAQRSRVVSPSNERAVLERTESARTSESVKQRLLLFQVGDDLRMAAPLEDASRLEEFAADAVEMSGDTRVVQYRDDILPLIWLNEFFGRAPAKEGSVSGRLQVVVVRIEKRSFGLVVDQIVDIIEEQVRVHRRVEREGVRGTAVIGGKVTDLIDVQAVVRRCEPPVAEPSVAERAVA